jgi:type I restriction enzyme, R subunit
MTTPEQRARQTIDALLTAAGWQVQDRAALNLSAARGVAVREFPLKTGFADYLLFVDRQAIGAVEAKPEGMPLSGIEAQSEGELVAQEPNDEPANALLERISAEGAIGPAESQGQNSVGEGVTSAR